jgi:hypothetical protein
MSGNPSLIRLQAFGFDTAQTDGMSTASVNPISGILAPAAATVLAPVIASALTPAAPIFPSLVIPNLMSGSSGALSFIRGELPFARVADWTHSLAKTPTDTWMDVVDGAVRGPNHRWMHHHPLDFAKAWSEQAPGGALQWDHYARHAFLDSVTLKGLPLLPEVVHAKLVGLGIPSDLLFTWTHLNAVDITLGSLSLVGGSTHLYMAITGCLPWQGTETFLLTFGVGGMEIASGIATGNPFLVVGGALDCAAGAVSYWQHIHVVEPSLIETLAPGLLGGLIGGGVVTATRMALCWNTSTQTEKIAMATESMGLSVLLGTLATISPWISVPLGVAYTAGKFAFKAAEEEDVFWINNPISSTLTPVLCRDALRRVGGEEAVRSFEEYLNRQTSLSIPHDARKALAAIPDWASVPESAKHVFGQRGRVHW